MANITDLAWSVIATAPSPATTGLNVNVQSGDGALFANTPLKCLMAPPGVVPTKANSERVLITARSGDTLTIAARDAGNYNSGTGRSVAVGWVIMNTPFADDFFNTSIVDNEVPGGLVNGSNTVYTVASPYRTGTLKVYKNGIRLKGGGADYTATSTGFTMITAPASGAVMLVDYEIGDTVYAVGSNSFTTLEAVSGSVNGSNTSFTTVKPYIANSLEVLINGLPQYRGLDYTESTPGSGIFTMAVAPNTGDAIRVNYQYNLNPASNADTVDGYHGDDLMPIGSLVCYASTTLPSGNWLLCYGQAVSRTTYSVLFARIGTAYGAGDGSTTFNIPDLRGRVPAGADNMGGTAANRLGTGQTGGITGSAGLGASGGEQGHVITQAESASHFHDLYVNGDSNYPAGFTGGAEAGKRASLGAITASFSGYPARTNVIGADGAHNNVQPTVVLNYIIKVS